MSDLFYFLFILNNTEEVTFVEEVEFFTFNLNGVTTEVGEENGITSLNLGSPVLGAGSDGDDGTFVDLSGDLFGDENTGLGLLGGGSALDEDAFTEGGEGLLEGGEGEAEHFVFL